MNFKDFITEGKMSEAEFIDRMVDVASDAKSINYMKMSTRDIIGELVTIIRKEKKYKALYTYWSKNRSKELMAELSKAFD